MRRTCSGKLTTKEMGMIPIPLLLRPKITSRTSPALITLPGLRVTGSQYSHSVTSLCFHLLSSLSLFLCSSIGFSLCKKFWHRVLFLCRQSIDLYSSVPSPTIGFLGTPNLSRISGSLLSSSLTRRHTPEVLPSVAKPLLPESEEEPLPHERHSSHTLIPQLPRKASARKDEKPTSKVSHEFPTSRQSSYGQAVLNGKPPSPFPFSFS